MGDFGPQFHGAGRCSMYLLWLESRLRDFLCIRGAQKKNDDTLLQKYNEMRRSGQPSREYEKEVAQWANKSLGQTIKEFLSEWPEYKRDEEVSRAFKLAEINRNGFAHAYMGSGDRLVFVPSQRTRRLIKETGLPIPGVDKPGFSLLLPCLYEPFVVRFYEGIKYIDFKCFRHVAEELGMTSYIGTFADPNWPVTEGINPVTLERVDGGDQGEPDL